MSGFKIGYRSSDSVIRSLLAMCDDAEGGVYVTGTGTGASTLSGVTVSGNTASETGGAGMLLGDSTWSNATLSGNQATTRAGGLYMTLGTTHQLTSCTLDGNTAEELLGEAQRKPATTDEQLATREKLVDQARAQIRVANKSDS